MNRSVLSNAFWNVVTGSSSALVSLLVPPVLTHALDADGFATWALALQIGTYINLLGFGLQTAVARYVALADAKGDQALRNGVVATAFYFLLVAGSIGWLLIVGLAQVFEHVVPNLPVALLAQERITIVLIGLASATSLVTMVFAAVFTGLRRSHVPAQVLGGGRLLIAAGLIASVQFTHDIATLAAVYLLINFGMSAVLVLTWWTKTPSPSLKFGHVSRRIGHELASFCFSLTIWSFAMLLVNGLDLVIVGRFAFAQTAYFAVSATLVTFIAGTLQSLANALVPVSAALTAEADGAALERLLERGSRLVVGASVLVATPLIFAPFTVLNAWLGPVYAARGAPLLGALAVAGMVRNLMLSFVVVSIGTGVQRRMLLTPLIEGAICILGSLLLIHHFGAIGIAFAKIAGALVAIALLLTQNALRHVIAGFDVGRYMLSGLLRPAMAWLPVAAVAFGLSQAPLAPLASLAILMVASGVAVWLIVLAPEDRLQAFKMIKWPRYAR